MKISKKSILYAVIVIVCIAVVIMLIPFAKLLYTEEGREIINQKIKSFGKLAPIVFIFLEFIQIIVAFVPGAPVEVLGGVLFGEIWGIILCFAGILLGTITVYNLVKRFGRPLVCKVFSEEKLKNSRLLNDEKKLTFIVFLLFLIPGTPKDLITYIVPLTKINPYKFFFIAVTARTPSLACSVFMGASLGEGRFIRSLILFAVIIVFSSVGYLLKNRLMKVKSKKQ